MKLESVFGEVGDGNVIGMTTFRFYRNKMDEIAVATQHPRFQSNMKSVREM